jgi:hypothetical protein
MTLAVGRAAMRFPRALQLALIVFAASACDIPGGRTGGTGSDAGSGSGSGSDGGSGSGGGTVYLYAHSQSTLYRVDPDSLAISEIGEFAWPINAPQIPDQMTDLAIDSNGKMVGVSFTSVYEVDPTTAITTLLSADLTESFNALSFVPASAIGGSGADVLVGARNSDGAVFRIDPSTGVSSQIGNMGGAFVSSGDLVAVDGFGTMQTVPGTGSSSGDQLVRLAANTFAATPIGTGTGFSNIWGLAFWKGKIYGFTNTGDFVLIDATTGSASLVVNNGVEWWGAAVTTVAPVIP